MFIEEDPEEDHLPTELQELLLHLVPFFCFFFSDINPCSGVEKLSNSEQLDH